MPFEAWKPGQSGNPSGRPKGTSKLRELCRAHTEKAIATLVEVMGGDGKQADRVRASEIILNRGWGTPAQEIAETMDPDAVLQIGGEMARSMRENPNLMREFVAKLRDEAEKSTQTEPQAE